MKYSPLLLLILVPMISGVICLALPDRFKNIIKAVSSVVSLAAVWLAISVFIKKPFLWNYGSYPMLVADNLAGFVAIFISVFCLLVTVYSFGVTEKYFGRYFGYILMTLGASMGAAFSNDMIAFLVFWGILAALLYLLVNIKQTDASAAAAKKALIIIGGTDALMIFGICLIWTISGKFAMNGARIPLDSLAAYTAYFSLAFAAFAKVGVFPFHSWLPDVAEASPAAVTAYLPASLDKLLGIYLLARISLNIFTMNAAMNIVLSFVGSVTIVFGVVMLLTQQDMKRFLGVSSISQAGYIVLGIGTGSAIGLAGALFHMLNHAIYKSCLLMTAGAVEKKAGTTDMAFLGGLYKYMPITFIACLVASMSISGIPPFNGFVSKWMIYQGIIESAARNNPLWAVWLVCAMFGSAVTIASFMKLLHAVFLGRSAQGIKDIREVGISMSSPMVALAATCIVFGIFATAIPLPVFILPSIGLAISYIGTWDPVFATALILAAIILGAFSYILLKPGTFRTVGVFVGGEDVSKMDRVTGTEFYDTIKDMPSMKAFYKREGAGDLDLYKISGRAAGYFTGLMKKLHNGILPTYLVWCLIGMIGIFLAIFLGQR